MKTNTILLLLLSIYIILLFSFKLTYSNDKLTYIINYNGLLWVALDNYTINKYHSNDIPMKWFNFTKVNNK
jgi:hypothetical protein